MTRRARHPVSTAIRDLHFNAKEQCYEIIESGVTYQMDLEMTRNLKKYFGGSGIQIKRKDFNISTWYESLTKQERKLVNRIGDIAKDNDGFYPDKIIDD